MILLTTKLLQRTILLVILVTEKLSCRSEIPREDVFRDPFHPHDHRIGSLDISRTQRRAHDLRQRARKGKRLVLVDLSRSRQNRRDDVRGHGVPRLPFDSRHGYSSRASSASRRATTFPQFSDTSHYAPPL